MHTATHVSAPVPTRKVTLLRHDDLIVVDLPETGTLIPRSEVRVDDAFLRDLTAEMAAVSGRRGTDPAAELARIGGLVFSHLLTEPARRRLRATSGGDLHLRLDERLVHVPWETCHDGDGFLFERFRIGRQVITGQLIPEPHVARAPHAGLRVLVIADPAEDLPQAAVEGERLCTLLDDVPGVTVTLLAGRSVRRIPLLAALQEHDVVHFAGHSHFDTRDPAQSGWRLADGVLTAADLAKLRPPPFLVFSNSCEAGASAAWKRDAGFDGHVWGIGSAFLLAGVPNYVGTFWVVHDDESLTFATAYYRCLAAGGSLGEALAEARTAVTMSHGRSLTWASYLQYGDPSARPVAAPAEPRTRRGPASTSSARFAVSLTAGAATPAVDRVRETQPLVGRDAELARLDAALAAALRGERRAVFVCGPPGIGKTTLLDAFAAASGDALVAHGQSVEHYGAGEAYLPLLEALGHLGRSADGATLVKHLRRHAPTWLAQLPALVDAAEQEALARRALGSTRERMLRELAELLDAFTAERPLVLVVEDLHWSDHATIEAISYVALRRSSARLLLLGTYRPAEVLSGEHPLRAATQELQARRLSEEIRLEPLCEADVGRYLAMRLDVPRVGDELMRVVYRRTEGHPLFLVNVVDFALREERIVARGGTVALRGGEAALADSIPDGLVPMIERQIEALAHDEQQLLEAAAVAGAEFSSATLVAALDGSQDAIEDRCEGLAWRGQFLRSAGMEKWPDGTLGGRYRFVHALYQNVLYRRVPEARRARLHRRIAERKAAAFGADTLEIAAELAVHFEAAHEPRRALEQRVGAGDLAVRRHGEREAVEHYRRALALHAVLPGPSDPTGELSILVKLATRLMSTAGYAAPELETLFDRAYTLSRQISSSRDLAPLLRTLVSFHQVRARLEAARSVGEELLALCARNDDEAALVQALYGHGVTLYDLGELEASQRHLERALERYRPATHETHVTVYGGYDPGVGSRCWLSWLLWLRGEGDRALRVAADGLALAEELGHPFSLGFACMSSAVLYLHRGETDAAAAPLARARQIAIEDGFPYLRATVGSIEAWHALASGRLAAAIELGEAALVAQHETGARLTQPAYRIMLAVAYGFSGALDEALASVDRGIAEVAETGQRLHGPGLWRARGELLGLRGDTTPEEIESCHRRALELARALHAPLVELQAALGMARHLRSTGRAAAARALVAPLRDGFREGLDTGILRDAHALLERC
jgi:tetratricopeptide (TPR) repeat protein